MREILTIIACLLVALLTAALAAPWFINWTAQRATIEAQLSQALGVQVKTHGSIDLKLLPTPRLLLEGVEVAGRQGPPVFRSGAARFELAVAPLLRGELHFIEASLDSPELRIDPAAGEGPVSAGPLRIPEEVRFERIQIHHGSLTLVRDTGDVTISGIDLDAEADSLLGPFKGTGTVARGDGVIPFRFATGAREDRRMRLKLIADPAQALPRIEVDGDVQLPEQGLAAVSFLGRAVLSGTQPVDWRASGPVRIDAAGAATDGLDLRIGPEDGGLAFEAKGELAASRPHAEVTLAARQMDLDRFAAVDSEGAARVLEILDRALEDPSALSDWPLPIRVSLQSPTVRMAGDALTDVALELGLAPGQPVSLSLGAAGPGRSELKLAGFVETGAAARYSGEVTASSGDLARLTEWLDAVAPAAAERLRSLPFHRIEVKGRAVASGAGVSASGLSLRVDRSSMTGAISYTRPVGDEPARFFADLTADAMDLDGVPDLSGPGRALADTDMQLALDARAVRLARFGQGMIDAGHIRLRLQKTKDELRIEDLSVADLGGANVSASGEVRSDEARVDVRLDAQRLGDLAGLLRRVAPGPWAEALASRAAPLSPARLTLHFGAERPKAGADFQVTGMRLDGSLRGTRISGRATPDGGDVNLQLSVEGGDAALLLRQLGFEALPLAGSGKARLAVLGRGALASGFDGTLSASLAGTDVTFSGHAGGDLSDPVLRGALTLRSEDAGRLLRLLAVALPDVTQSVPVDLQGRISSSGGTIQVDDLAGRVADAQLTGTAKLVGAGGPRLQGSLQIDQASVPALVALLLGPPQAARPGARWSAAAFAPGMQNPLPVEIAVQAKSLHLANHLATQDASFTLRFAPGLLAFDRFGARLDRGALSGGLVMRRDGPTASLSGSLQLADVPMDRAGVSGLLSGSVDFTSTGANAAALAGGLAGSGKARIAQFSFARADPSAPARVIAQADEGSIYVSENDYLGALRRELDHASLDLGDRSFDLSMAAGVLRLASASGQSLTLDLRTLSVEARTLLTADPLPKDWSGPAPQLTVIDRDGTRDLDAGAFVNALAARAIAREAARVEALEADIRERAAFARRRRGLDFLHQREKEVAAFEAEQARLAHEAEKRAAEEAARQAESERRRIAEDERRRLQQLSAPIRIVPLPPRPPPVVMPPPAAADPGAAGR